MGTLDLVLLLDFSVLAEIELEQAIGLKANSAETIEFYLLMLLYKHVNLECHQVLAQLEQHVMEAHMSLFRLSKPLLIVLISLLFPPKMACEQIFGKCLRYT